MLATTILLGTYISYRGCIWKVTYACPVLTIPGIVIHIHPTVRFEHNLYMTCISYIWNIESLVALSSTYEMDISKQTQCLLTQPFMGFIPLSNPFC